MPSVFADDWQLVRVSGGFAGFVVDAHDTLALVFSSSPQLPMLYWFNGDSLLLEDNIADGIGRRRAFYCTSFWWSIMN
jgi:hypothetical protein